MDLTPGYGELRRVGKHPTLVRAPFHTHYFTRFSEQPREACGGVPVPQVRLWEVRQQIQGHLRCCCRQGIFPVVRCLTDLFLPFIAAVSILCKSPLWDGLAHIHLPISPARMKTP